MPGLSGIGPQLIDEQPREQDHAERKHERDEPGDLITAAQPTQKSARAPGEARGVDGGGSCGHLPRY